MAILRQTLLPILEKSNFLNPKCDTAQKAYIVSDFRGLFHDKWDSPFL
jgi:hypothetical protein